MNRPLNIVFCLPGNSYSGNFLKCWHELTIFCLHNNINPILSQNYSCNIYYSRSLCLGGNSTLGEFQKPFDNKIDYDYLMWIDSDVIFKPSDLIRLLSHKLDIVSGLYLTQNGNTYATVKDWDIDKYKQNGRFDFLTPRAITERVLAPPRRRCGESTLGTHTRKVSHTRVGSCKGHAPTSCAASWTRRRQREGQPQRTS